jgi:hypothetical protein
MNRKLKLKVGAGVAAAAAVAGGGAAIAADRLGSSSDSQAVVNDAAKQLGVTPSALSAALKKALENRVDAAVAAGRLTKAQGDEIKQRIESGDFPLFSGPGLGFGFHHAIGLFGGGFDAAATYLGLTEDQLRTQLESGKSLADVAKAKGKSVDGLIEAIVADAKTRLDAAVKAGRITQSQEDSILSDLKSHVTDFVNGTPPARPGFGFRHFDGGPPPDGPFPGPGI